MNWKAILLMICTCSMLGAISLETIDPQDLLDTCQKIEANDYFRTMRNALCQNPPYRIARNWECLCEDLVYFNHEVEPSFSVTNQKGTGRCWIFAALNVVRCHFDKKVHIKEFEFSQSYLYFFDKVEKANFFLERIIETYEEPLNSMSVVALLMDPIPDGGWWCGFVNLVRKYGLVPKTVYPESEICYDSAFFNHLLQGKLLKGAEAIRSCLNGEGGVEKAREEKNRCMQEIYQILVLHMGVPPCEFDWSYCDEEKNHYEHKNLTPLAFANEIVEFPLDDYVVLANSPREQTPFYVKYSIPHSSFMAGGKDYAAVNLPISDIKEIAKAVIVENDPICFSADICQQCDVSSGILDANLYEFNSLYQVDFSMDKGARMEYRVSGANHAMTFVGLLMEEGVAKRWKVENSWGAKYGQEGMFRMSDSWFDEYVFEIVVSKKHLPNELIDLFQGPSTPLEPWDPMGALSD